MFCYKCGLKIEAEAHKCPACGAPTAHVMKYKSKTFKASIVFGILLLATPFFPFLFNFWSLLYPYYIIIFGLIGLPLAFLSRQRAALVLNIIGIAVWVLLIITPYFSDRVPSREQRDASGSAYAKEYKEGFKQ